MTAAAVVVFLIAVNAVFVAAEYSTVSVRRTQISQLASQGSSLARRVLPIVSGQQRLYIAVCQIGISSSGLILGAYSEYAFAGGLARVLGNWFHVPSTAALPAAAATILICLSTAQIMLGELLPKAVATRYPVQTALATAIPMSWSCALFRWSGFVGLLQGSAALILRLLRVPLQISRHVHQAEEIDMLVEETHEQGLLNKSERERLHNVFRLATHKVREVMVPRVHVFALSVSTGPTDLIDQCIDSPFTRIPVYRDSLDDIIGVIHVKDLLSMAYSDPEGLSVEPVIRSIPRVLETMPINRLLEDMRAAHTQMSVVVDEYGGTSGIVTLEDLLEEVVGEIPDEFEKDFGKLEARLPDGRLRVEGHCNLDDVARLVGSALEYEEANTVAGLMMGLLGRVPAAGDQVLFAGCLFEAERASEHALESVLVTPGAVGPETLSDD